VGDTSLSDIEARLTLLEKRVSEIEYFLRSYFPLTIEKLLQLRGLEIARDGKAVELPYQEELFEKFKSYYFRRILHDIFILKKIDKSGIEKLSNKWGSQVYEDIDLFIKYGFVSKQKDGSLIANYQSGYMGTLLEWFIGKFLRDTLHLEVEVNVKLKNLMKGGDIDVVARIGTKLLVIECKESPPNNVPVSEMKAIWERFLLVKPDISILLVDTTLSVKRNILDNLHWITKSDYEKIHEGVYRFSKNLFVINAKRDLLQNLEIAIKDGLNGLRAY
jgi:hypothetical protein